MMKRVFSGVIFAIALFFGTVRLDAAENSAVQQPPVTVKIDVNKKGEPLSPLIYSQFIEHLGRCIYGGIWAEMLEDRKFYYGVGEKESPWSVSQDGEVVMSRKNPFVGDHTPRILLNKETSQGGITQKNLAFQAKKKYIGYLWLKYVGEIKSVDIIVETKDSGVSETITTLSVPLQKGDYYKHEFDFESMKNSNDGTLTINASGNGIVSIGTISLMPADNVHGMRKDTLALLKELNAPLYRWPGGNFVSGYDWKDGIGDRDKRPPRKNPAWTGVEHNDFGVNEFMLFCKTLGTEPYIAVNTGAGKVENALDELQYVNGSKETKWGKLRTEQGHAEPYKVNWWGIGNEMYGNWQIGHIPVEEYVKKHNEFVDTFRKEDPTIRVIGVGAVGKWDEVFLPGAANHLDELSEHFYVQEKSDVAEHTRLIPDQIKRIADAHRKYRETMPALKGKNIKIAMDEWNYWYGPHLFGELGTRYFQKDGLGIAAGINEFARQSDIYIMANYAQTVNVIGCIKTNKTNAQFETTGLVLKLYRHEFGSIPVATEIVSDAKSPLDVQAALSDDGKTLTVSVVNPLDREVELKLDTAFEKTSGKRFEIVDPQNDPKGFNDPGQKQRIATTESDFSLDGGKVKVKPVSVTLFKFN